MPEVNKTERKATKFVSAEEEAAKCALKAQKDAALIAATTALSEIPSETTDGDSKLSVLEDGNNALLRLEAVSDMSPRPDNPKSPVADDIASSELSIKPSAIRRRQSILDSSNPDMLNTLNKMMSLSDIGSSMKGSPRLFPITPKIAPKETDTIVEVKEKEVKVSKSKLLQANYFNLYQHCLNLTIIISFQKLAGGSVADASPSLGRPAMPSFLDQLKAKGKSLFAAAAGASDDTKPSFLDQIKLKSKAVE